MKCPFCGHNDTQVVETRLSEEGDTVRRRRKCGQCEKRFTTYERAEVTMPVVVKKDGRRVEYDRHKLQASFALALRKRLRALAEEGAPPPVALWDVLIRNGRSFAELDT